MRHMSAELRRGEGGLNMICQNTFILDGVWPILWTFFSTILLFTQIVDGFGGFIL